MELLSNGCWFQQAVHGSKDHEIVTNWIYKIRYVRLTSEATNETWKLRVPEMLDQVMVFLNLPRIKTLDIAFWNMHVAEDPQGRFMPHKFGILEPSQPLKVPRAAKLTILKIGFTSCVAWVLGKILKYTPNLRVFEVELKHTR